MTRILIAEDEPRIAAFLSQGLSSNGYAVTVATDGRTALHLARSGEADLMVLDLGLPGLDGAAVLAELRAARSALPVIVLTARTSLQDTVDILDAGADDFMPKPFRIDELLARIRLRLQPDRAAESTVLRHRELALDLRTRRVTVAGCLAELTARRPPGSSRSPRPCSATRGRSSAVSSCSTWSGATTTTPARTSSTSTSGICAASSAATTSPRCAEPVTAWNEPLTASAPGSSSEHRTR